MSRKPRPLFLERRSYRRRRVADAARLLPLVGSVLVFVPILWLPDRTAAPDTVRGGLYLFAVWALLIGVAFALSRVLSGEGERSSDAGPD